MADSKIPLSDLPQGVPGAFDKVAGVDTATGEARQFSLFDIRNVVTPPAMYQQMLYLQAGLQNAMYPAGILSPKIVVRKQRSDRAEFLVYTPLSVDGREWCRWLFTNRFNSGSVGAPRMYRCSLATLNKTDLAPPHPANLSSGTQAQTATVNKGTAGADGTTGTWTTASTVSGVPDIRYSTNPGDTVTYSLIGVSRIALRTLTNTANGGVVRVVVRDGNSAEISNGYTVPLTSGERRIDLNPVNGYTLTGQNFITVADGLDVGDYTVEISVVASRGYDGGVVGYAAPDLNADGYLGTTDDVTISGAVMRRALSAGARATYHVSGTRIDWRHGVLTNAGIASVQVYDDAGVEIQESNYRVAGKQVDSYGTGSTAVTTTIADGLAPGVYTVVVQALPTRNPSASGYRLYDNGVVGVDASRVGVPGVDQFDDHGVDDGSAIQPPYTLIGSGNLELAMQVCKPAEDAGGALFVGGTHGFETTPVDTSFALDGAGIDFAAAAVGTQWVGSRLRVGCSTSLLFPSDSSPFAAVDYQLGVSRDGYGCAVTRTMTADAKVVEDYSFMLNVPNTAGGPNNQGIGGGFEVFSAYRDTLPSRVFTEYQSLHHELPYPVRMALFVNQDYVVTGEQVNLDEVLATYEGRYESSSATSFVQERTDGFVKWYNRAFSGSGLGVIVPSGDSYTHRNAYRVVRL